MHYNNRWPGIGLYRRGLKRVLRLVIPAFAISRLVAVAEASDMEAFVSAYRCPLTHQFEELSRRPDGGAGHHRFLVLSLSSSAQSYVQCLFTSQGAELLCEASSGYYAQPVGEPSRFRLSPDAVAALATLGFSIDDGDGNYRRMINPRQDGGFAAVAELLLTALYTSYEARMSSRIELRTDLSRRLGRKLLPAQCPPPIS